MKCIFGCRHAVAVYIMPKGCVCKPQIVQALCAQHEYKRRPLGGSFLVARLDTKLEPLIFEQGDLVKAKKPPPTWWVDADPLTRWDGKRP